MFRIILMKINGSEDVSEPRWERDIGNKFKNIFISLLKTFIGVGQKLLKFGMDM
jgi:hypothetical protein